MMRFVDVVIAIVLPEFGVRQRNVQTLCERLADNDVVIIRCAGQVGCNKFFGVIVAVVAAEVGEERVANCMIIVYSYCFQQARLYHYLIYTRYDALPSVATRMYFLAE